MMCTLGGGKVSLAKYIIGGEGPPFKERRGVGDGSHWTEHGTYAI